MAKKKKKVAVNKFQAAVLATPQIRDAYQQGLSALSGHKAKVTASSVFQGSVDIDEAVKKHYPQDNRWDYTIGYKDKAYFVEVHSANSSEVSVVVAKLNWLKQWLLNQAPELNRIKAENAFHWIQSSNFNIPKLSRHYRIAQQHGIVPKPSLNLS